MGKTKRVGSVLGKVMVYVLIWLGITLLFAGIGIHIFWGSISVDQMMMNLVAAQADGGGGALVWIGIFGFGVAPVALTLLIAYLRHRYVRGVQRSKQLKHLTRLSWQKQPRLSSRVRQRNPTSPVRPSSFPRCHVCPRSSRRLP